MAKAEKKKKMFAMVTYLHQGFFVFICVSMQEKARWYNLSYLSKERVQGAQSLIWFRLAKASYPELRAAENNAFEGRPSARGVKLFRHAVLLAGEAANDAKDLHTDPIQDHHSIRELNGSPPSTLDKKPQDTASAEVSQYSAN